MSVARRLRLDLVAHVAFAAAIVVIFVMGWTLYGVATSMQRAAAWSDEAIEGLQAIADVEAAYGQAHRAHGALLLTGDARFAAERDKAAEAAGAHLNRLGNLVALGASQRDLAAQMRTRLSERVAAMRQEQALRATQGIEAAAAAVAAREAAIGKRFSELATTFEAEELRRLGQRRGAQAEDFGTKLYAVGAAALLAFLVLVPGYMGFVMLSREREAAQSRVLEVAENLPAAAFQYRALTAGGGRYEFFSRSAERLRGVSRADAMADPAAVLGTVVDKDRFALLEALEKAGVARAPLQHDFRVHDAEGRIRWLRVNSVPSPRPDGILWTGVWEDVTDRMRMMRALEEAKAAAEAVAQARARFAGALNHELRTPLSAALGALELLARTNLGKEQRDAVSLAFASSKSALGVVEDLADFARIEAGSVALRPEPVSIQELVGEVAQAHAARLADRGVTMRHSTDGRISPLVMADPQRLRQILNNFVTTLEEAGRKGVIEMRAELAESRDGEEVVKVSVRETGSPGVVAGVKERAFEPFVQVSESPTRRYDGSGLGLAMGQRLAALMGGKVDIANDPATGMLLVLTLPVPIARKDARAPAADPASEAAPRSLDAPRAAPSIAEAKREGTLVLVVDDHPVSRLVMLRQVNALGYAAVCAADGADALQRWSAGGFSLVLTDCDMPEMDGYELARHIRSGEARGSRPRVPILACTANTLGDPDERAIEAGMDDFMTKPVSMAQLAEKLGRWLPLPGSPLALAPKTPTRPLTPPPPDGAS